MKDIQAKLDYADAIADWLTRIGKAHAERGKLEEALFYTSIAANILAGQSRTLSSSRIEANLLYVADRLPAADIKPCPPHAETCLHVISEALPAGGLTAMAVRWMTNDRSGRRHSVALLRQTAAIPQELLTVVADRGGSVLVADSHSSLVARAIWLRKLAYAHASHVVLHTDPSDVICGAAFGIPGGPPVMFVNHAAHIFSTGPSITDLLLNIRGGDLEGIWATLHRGVPRFAAVPIPLPEHDPSCLSDAGLKQRRVEVRRRLGLAPNTTVLMTAGAFFKYLPIEGMDFVATCEQLLHELPEGVLLVAGFHGDKRWQDTSRRVGSRIRTLGRISQAELADLHTASDIYLEAFPFGTTTSLLESALRGLPVVLAPATCPPPYGSDGLAIDDVANRTATPEDYIREVIRLARNPADRAREGHAIQKSVYSHHIGDGWREHLADALRALPAEHLIYPLDSVIPTPTAVHEHWAKLAPCAWQWSYEEMLEETIFVCLRHNVKPSMDDLMRQACRKAWNIRSGRSIPVPLLTILLNYFFRFLPVGIASGLLRVVAFMCRGSLTRLGNRLALALRLKAPPRRAYDEYR